MIGSAELLAAAGKAGEKADDIGVLDVLQAAAGATTALTVIVGAAWWVLGPRIRTFVQNVAQATEELRPNHGTTVRDQTAKAAEATDLILPQLAELRRGQDVTHALLTETRERLDNHIIASAVAAASAAAAAASHKEGHPDGRALDAGGQQPAGPAGT